MSKFFQVPIGSVFCYGNKSYIKTPKLLGFNCFDMYTYEWSVFDKNTVVFSLDGGE